MNEIGLQVLLGLAGLFLAFVVIWVVGRLRAWKTRRQKIAEWARSHGLEFAPGPVDASALAPLSDRGAVNVLFSEEALEFFDQNVGWTVEGEGSHLLVGLKPIFEGWRRPEIEDGWPTRTSTGS